MDIAFTGSQHGMSTAQLHTLKQWTFENVDDIDTWHHGVCVGADTQSFLQTYQVFESFMPDRESLEKVFHFHPPINTDKMSDLRTFPGTWHKPEKYIGRNHIIVDSCDLLIAAPKHDNYSRGGTWATVNYARKTGKKVLQLRRLGGFI